MANSLSPDFATLPRRSQERDGEFGLFRIAFDCSNGVPVAANVLKYFCQEGSFNIL